jgi:hypothetical protein
VAFHPFAKKGSAWPVFQRNASHVANWFDDPSVSSPRYAFKKTRREFDCKGNFVCM